MTEVVFVSEPEIKDFLDFRVIRNVSDVLMVPVPSDLTTKLLDELSDALMDYRGPRGILFRTSGSIGVSKLVVRSFTSLSIESAGIVDRLNLTPNTRLLIGSPVTHSFGFGMLAASVSVGCQVQTVPFSASVFHRAAMIRDALHFSQIDVMTATPFIYRLILRDSPIKRVPEGICYAGGEMVDESLIAEWEQTTRLLLRQEYGTSETGILSFGSSSCHGDPASIGWPIPGYSFEEKDGELIVNGPDIPVSYLNEVSPDFAGGKFWTGDLVERRGSLNEYYIVGRKKSMISVAGSKMAPEEVESVIRASGLTHDEVVFGEPHDVRGEMPVAMVVANSDYSTAGLRSFLRINLPSFKVPRLVEVDSIPRTSSGKVARHEIGM